MILKGESAEEFNRKADENYEKFKARQKQNLIDMMEADEKLGLYEQPQQETGECTCGTNTSSDGKTFAVTDIKCKIHGFGIEKPLDQTQELLNEARDLMESFDDCAAMTVGYDKKEYTLTAKQMTLIAGALYLVDCKLNQNKEDE
jgi:hypothetical protein